MSFEPLLKPEEVSKLLGVSRRTVQRMADAHELPAVRVGKFWRFEREVLQRWLESGRGSAQ